MEQLNRSPADWSLRTTFPWKRSWKKSEWLECHVAAWMRVSRCLRCLQSRGCSSC